LARSEKKWVYVYMKKLPRSIDVRENRYFGSAASKNLIVDLYGGLQSDKPLPCDGRTLTSRDGVSATSYDLLYLCCPSDW